jgi:CheY-like chemotaxis protein
MHVLFVDDDEVLAQAVEMALRENGHVCEITDLGKEALTLSKRNAYDIVVLDVGLPDMDGCHVVRRMKVEGVETPVLLHSGLLDPELTAEAASLGVEHFLAKPFSIAELIDRMEAALGYCGIDAPEPTPEPTPESSPDAAPEPARDPPSESRGAEASREPGCPAHPNPEARPRPVPLPDPRPKTAHRRPPVDPAAPRPGREVEAKPAPRPEAEGSPKTPADPPPAAPGQDEPAPRPAAVAAARAALRAEPETPTGLQAVSEVVAERGAKALARAVTTARSAMTPKAGCAAEARSDADPAAAAERAEDPESDGAAGRLSKAMAKARDALAAEPLSKAVAKGRAALDAKPLARFASDAKAAFGTQPLSKAAAKARAALAARVKAPAGPPDAAEAEPAPETIGANALAEPATAEPEPEAAKGTAPDRPGSPPSLAPEPSAPEAEAAEGPESEDEAEVRPEEPEERDTLSGFAAPPAFGPGEPPAPGTAPPRGPADDVEAETGFETARDGGPTEASAFDPEPEAEAETEAGAGRPDRPDTPPPEPAEGPEDEAEAQPEPAEGPAGDLEAPTDFETARGGGPAGPSAFDPEPVAETETGQSRPLSEPSAIPEARQGELAPTDEAEGTDTPVPPSHVATPPVIAPVEPSAPDPEPLDGSETESIWSASQPTGAPNPQPAEPDAGPDGSDGPDSLTATAAAPESQAAAPPPTPLVPEDGSATEPSRAEREPSAMPVPRQGKPEADFEPPGGTEDQAEGGPRDSGPASPPAVSRPEPAAAPEPASETAPAVEPAPASEPGPAIGDRAAAEDGPEASGAERRRHRRMSVIEAALIEHGEHHSPCVILNRSESGAALRLSDPARECPESFTLQPLDGPPRPCKRRWRRGDKIGVEFC